MLTRKLGGVLVRIGWFSLGVGLTILAMIYWPIAKVEVNYQFNHSFPDLTPIDSDFGLVIPKIGANAKVIVNVDPFNSREYQRALTQGVAHARGSSLPGQPGNVFIFSHSSVNFYEAGRYNSIFYLLNKLEIGDEIRVYFKDNRYVYYVTEIKIVSAGSVNYLKSVGEAQTLTLMTCSPPGTRWQRLLVIAKLAS